SLGSNVQSERGLATRLRSENLNNASTRQASATEGDVEREATGRNALDRQQLIARQRHNRAFAKLLFNRGDRVAQLRAGLQNAVGFFGLLGWFLGNLFGFGHTIICAWGSLGGWAVISCSRNHEPNPFI